MMRHPIDRLISQFFYCPRDHDIQGRPAKVHTANYTIIVTPFSSCTKYMMSVLQVDGCHM